MEDSSSAEDRREEIRENQAGVGEESAKGDGGEKRSNFFFSFQLYLAV